MKTSLLVLLVALSASSALATSPAAPASTPFAYTVSAIPQPNQADISLGATRTTVRRMMGPPLRQLAANVWAYAGYHPDVAAEQEHGCNTLIITFTDGRVSDLKIANPHAASLIAASLQTSTAPVHIAKN